jgi:hypothetical protein
MWQRNATPVTATQTSEEFDAIKVPKFVLEPRLDGTAMDIGRLGLQVVTRISLQQESKWREEWNVSNSMYN